MTDYRFAPETDPAPRSVTVTGGRKDGKFAVRYHYPLSGRSFNKIVTRDQILLDCASGYAVSRRDLALIGVGVVRG